MKVNTTTTKSDRCPDYQQFSAGSYKDFNCSNCGHRASSLRIEEGLCSCCRPILATEAEREQPAPEGEEWRSVDMTDTAFDHRPTITIEQGGKLLATAYSPEVATAILRDHRLAALVPGLVEALRDLVECSPCQNGCAPDDMTCATRKAEHVLNAVARGREE